MTSYCFHIINTKYLTMIAESGCKLVVENEKILVVDKNKEEGILGDIVASGSAERSIGPFTLPSTTTVLSSPSAVAALSSIYAPPGGSSSPLPALHPLTSPLPLVPRLPLPLPASLRPLAMAPSTDTEKTGRQVWNGNDLILMIRLWFVLLMICENNQSYSEIHQKCYGKIPWPVGEVNSCCQG